MNCFGTVQFKQTHQLVFGIIPVFKYVLKNVINIGLIHINISSEGRQHLISVFVAH